MADMYLDVDTAVTVHVNVLPLLDDTDFKSIEEAVAYNAAGMDLNWNFITSAGVITQTNVVPTTAGLHDWTHVGNGIYKIEIPASGGTVNNDTEGYGWFSGVCTGVLPWCGPRIGFRAAGLNDKLCDSAYSTTRGLAGTALPDAAADDLGGLAVSDAGGLDLDAILADTNELQTNQGNWVTATGFSTHNAAAVVTALGTGSTLTSCVTATGFSTHSAAAVKTAIEAAGSSIAIILADTNELQTNQGNWVTATGFSTHDAAAVKTAIEAAGSHLALILADTGELQTNQGNWATATGFSTHDAAAVVTALGTGSTLTACVTATGFSTHNAAAVKTAMEADGSKLDHLWEMTEDDAGTRRLTTNSLEQAPSGGLDAAGVRTAVGLASANLDTQLTAIVTDTNELQTDWADGGRLDLILDAVSGAGANIATEGTNISTGG